MQRAGGGRHDPRAVSCESARIIKHIAIDGPTEKWHATAINRRSLSAVLPASSLALRNRTCLRDTFSRYSIYKEFVALCVQQKPIL